MTISTSTNRYTYAGNGVTTAFAYSSRFLANADIVVLLVVDATGVSTTQVLTTNYTMTGAGDAGGGTITMLVAPPTGTTLVIYGDPEIKQATDFVENDALPAETLETAYDRLTLIAARLKDQISRAFKLNDADTTTSPTLPTPTASSGLGWNAAGTALVNYIFQTGTSLIDLAASTGSSLVGFIQSGTGAVATTVQDELRRSVTPEQFGCIGDGTTDDTVAFGKFMDNANNANCLLIGVYKLTSLMTKPLTNSRWFGIPGKTKITGSFGYATLRLSNLSEVEFDGVVFETTYTNAAEDMTYSVLYSVTSSIYNTRFNRCTFTAPNANTGGFTVFSRLSAGDTSGSVDGLWVEDCTFINIGRIACTLMNRSTTGDSYSAMQRVYFNRNKGINLGLNNNFGFLISLDGRGRAFEVNENHIENAYGIGIENTGWSYGEIRGNTGAVFSRNYALLQFSGTTMVGLSVENNSDMETGNARIIINNVSDSSFKSNNFKNTDSVSIVQVLNASNNRFIAEHYTSAGAGGNPLRVGAAGSPSVGNHFSGECILDSSGSSTAGLVCAQFDGTGTIQNTVDQPMIIKKASDYVGANASSAADNLVIDYKTPTSQTGQGYRILYISDENSLIYGSTLEVVLSNCIKVSGTLTAPRTLTIPASMFIHPLRLYNNTGQILNLYCGATAGPALANGANAELYLDTGTNVIKSF